MGMFETLLVVFIILVVFAIPFAVFAFVRYLRYKETIALAERGLVRPQRKRSNKDTLRWGIVITMLGLGLICGFWLLGFMLFSSGSATSADSGASAGDPFPFGLGPWLILGILPFFFGLSLLIIHWIGKDREAETGDEDEIPAHKLGGSDREREI